MTRALRNTGAVESLGRSKAARTVDEINLMPQSDYVASIHRSPLRAVQSHPDTVASEVRGTLTLPMVALMTA